MRHVNFDPNPKHQAKSDQVMEKLTSGEEVPLADSVNIDDSTLTANIIDALKEIYDPEIPLNIYDLGLIYKVQVEKGVVDVDMTLTTPGCPVAQTFPGMVENSVKRVAGVASATVHLVWEPAWTQDNLTDEARLQMGLI